MIDDVGINDVGINSSSALVSGINDVGIYLNT